MAVSGIRNIGWDSTTGQQVPFIEKFYLNSDGTMSDASAANVDTGAIHTLAAQGAATLDSADQINISGKGLKLVVDITAVSGSPTLTVTIQGKDTASGKYYTLLVSAALSAVATTVLTIYPGLTAAANVTASDILPKTWRVRAVVAGATPAVTGTIGASVID